MAQIGFEDPAGSGLYETGDVAAQAGGFYSTTGFEEDPSAPGLFLMGKAATTAPILNFLPGYAAQHLAPRVEVVATLFPPGADTVVYYRSDNSRTWTVRGGVNRSVAGGVALIDWEAPFGVPVMYRAEMFDADGVSIGFTDSASITLDVDEVWIQHVLEPKIAVQYQLTKGAVDELEFSSKGDLLTVEGSFVSKFVGSQRLGLVSVDLSGWTRTFEDAEILGSMLGSYTVARVPIVCVRAPRQYQLPPTFIAQVEMSRVPFDTFAGGEANRWKIVANEVQPPAVGLVEASLTWDDLAAAYSTWDEVAAAYGSWLDASRDYSLAGLAG